LDDVAVPPDEAAATHAWPGLRTTIARLLALDGRRVQALSATFSLSVGREAGAVLEPELWTDLDGSERLALEILTPVIR
jgi:hypothetical protein